MAFRTRTTSTPTPRNASATDVSISVRRCSGSEMVSLSGESRWRADSSHVDVTEFWTRREKGFSSTSFQRARDDRSKLTSPSHFRES